MFAQLVPGLFRIVVVRLFFQFLTLASLKLALGCICCVAPPSFEDVNILEQAQPDITAYSVIYIYHKYM